MTWSEFKDALAEKGVLNDMTINYIDIFTDVLAGSNIDVIIDKTTFSFSVIN